MKKFYIVLLALFSTGVGTFLGFGIAMSQNIDIVQRNSRENISLPTKVFDKHGELITTFFATKNRKLVQVNEVPRILLQALITREDKTFFQHNGFSVRGTMRAVVNLLLNNYVSGGSTLSQQVAGVLYADRRQFSIARKLKELWWSFQLEKSWSKQELLEEYINKMYFGHGNYGVETSSQFFFEHSAKTLNSAEAVILVIQLANPLKYSPFKNPNIARKRQKEILEQMVELNFVSKKTAETDFNMYWENFDFTREGFSSAFLKRNDKASYFSEYIRNLLLNTLDFSAADINTKGYEIHTTLDMNAQRAARKYFNKGLAKANRLYKSNTQYSQNITQSILPIAALSMTLFDSNNSFFTKNSLQLQNAKKQFFNDGQPLLALSNLLFQPSTNTLSAQIATRSKDQSTEVHQEETVEGALISIDNKNGAIIAMIGGSKFDATNQFNRAVNAFVQPGSAFKPLYYAAALDAKIITPSTIIWDSPVVFTDKDGTQYTPLNFKGEWKGPVTVRTALSKSMNIPSVKVLHKTGFERVLNTTGELLGISLEARKSSGLVPRYPIGLGVVSVSPLAMVKAYATIQNQGIKMSTYAIEHIKDRKGITIYTANKRNNTFENKRVISKEAAYVLSSILQSTTKHGTLRYARYLAKGFTQPTAGKTGTTQNWSDAWTIGFTPYYTTALWLGFDRGGQSLGTNQTGAITAGPVWAQYMEEINKDLPKKKFEKPSGVVEVLINPQNNTRAVSNSLRKIKEVYIIGTEPQQYDKPRETAERKNMLVEKLQNTKWNIRIPMTLTPRSTNKPKRKISSINLRLSVPSERSLKHLPSSSSVSNSSSPSSESTEQDEELRNPLLD